MSEAFERFVSEARGDPRVLALFVYGSQAKGRATAHSDYDFGLIVVDAAASDWTSRLEALDNSQFDGRLFSFAAFEAWADWNSPQRWVRYAMDGARLAFDRTGKVQGLIDAKARIPPAEIEAFVDQSLDHFVNQVYRCAKCRRDGDLRAARLEAVEAVAPLLDAVFGLDDGRLRPYPKHLAWELEARPPAAMPFPAEAFLAMLDRLFAGADLEMLQEMLAALEPIGRAAGHAAVFDAWGEALPWMLSFRRPAV
ncbi:MAG TPA: hypothetical protein VII63_05080 [Caulobacteraceae bacterium]